MTIPDESGDQKMEKLSVHHLRRKSAIRVIVYEDTMPPIKRTVKVQTLIVSVVYKMRDKQQRTFTLLAKVDWNVDPREFRQNLSLLGISVLGKILRTTKRDGPSLLSRSASQFK